MNRTEPNSTQTFFTKVIFLCKKNLLDQKSSHPKSTELKITRLEIKPKTDLDDQKLTQFEPKSNAPFARSTIWTKVPTRALG